MPEVWTNKSFYSIGFYSYDNLAHHGSCNVFVFEINPALLYMYSKILLATRGE